MTDKPLSVQVTEMVERLRKMGKADLYFAPFDRATMREAANLLEKQRERRVDLAEDQRCAFCSAPQMSDVVHNCANLSEAH